MTPLLARLSAALDNPAFAAFAWLVVIAFTVTPLVLSALLVSGAVR